MSPVAADVAGSVCDCVLTVEHNLEPHRNTRTDRGAVCDMDSGGPKNHELRGGGFPQGMQGNG